LFFFLAEAVALSPEFSAAVGAADHGENERDHRDHARNAEAVA